MATDESDIRVDSLSLVMRTSDVAETDFDSVSFGFTFRAENMPAFQLLNAAILVFQSTLRVGCFIYSLIYSFAKGTLLEYLNLCYIRHIEINKS